MAAARVLPRDVVTRREAVLSLADAFGRFLDSCQLEEIDDLARRLARHPALRGRTALRTASTRAAALRRAVLTAAFSGHLTSTTDPSDLLQESIA